MSILKFVLIPSQAVIKLPNTNKPSVSLKLLSTFSIFHNDRRQFSQDPLTQLTTPPPHSGKCPQLHHLSTLVNVFNYTTSALWSMSSITPPQHSGQCLQLHHLSTLHSVFNYTTSALYTMSSITPPQHSLQCPQLHHLSTLYYVLNYTASALITMFSITLPVHSLQCPQFYRANTPERPQLQCLRNQHTVLKTLLIILTASGLLTMSSIILNASMLNLISSPKRSRPL